MSTLLTNKNYFTMPKVLFFNQKYKGLSLESKSLYMILLSKQDEGKEDDNGYIFFDCGADELSEIMEVSKGSLLRYKKQLTKYDLLYEKRLGQGNNNRLYLLKPESCEDYNPLKKKRVNSLREKNKAEYRKYLKSEHWQSFREKAINHYGDACCLCGSNEKISVHHLTYKNRGHENINDVTVLCDRCHKEIHGIK